MPLQFESATPLDTLNVGSEYERFGFVKQYVGAASVHAAVESPELDTLDSWNEIADYAGERELPVKVVGGTTNMYLTEEGYGGLLVTYRYDRTGSMRPDPDTGIVTVPAPAPLGSFVRAVCVDYERPFGNLAGIPGTIGGAVLGNAGRTVSRDNLGDIVTQVVAYDLNERKEVTFDTRGSDLGQPFFGQRSSWLRGQNFPNTRYVIRSVEADVGTDTDPNAVELYINRYREREGHDGHQGKNQEGEKTVGSIFVNAKVPPEISTCNGRRTLVRHLIKQAVTAEGKPLIGINVNGARFTGEHAFLKTSPQTRDRDVAELLETTLRTLEDNFGFRPQLEVDILGPNGSMTIDEFINSQR